MVVRHDYIHAKFFRKRQFLCVRRTAIHGDYKIGSLLRAFFNRVLIQAEALVVPVRNVERNIFIPRSVKKVREHYRSRYAVGIVVRENHNMFIFLHRSYHPIASLLHVWEQKRVMQSIIVRIEKVFLFFRRDTSLF